MIADKKSKRNLKQTAIPLAIQLSTTLGIISFPQNNSIKLQKPQIKVQSHHEQITYKNAVGRDSDSDSDEQQFIKKKIIPMSRVTIKPQNLKKKYFKVDIPINKGQIAGVKNNKQKIHFVIQFNHDNKGSLTIFDDVYDCQMEITNAEKQMSFQDKLKIQSAKLDSRRRQEKVQIMEEKKDGRKK